MTFARGLYERFRQLIHEAAKFGIVGVIGLVITNGGYEILHNGFGVGPIKATTIATFVATVVAYLGNRYWSFRHRERTGVVRESVIFFVLNGIGLLIQDAAVGFNYYILGLQNNKIAGLLALNFGIAVATLFRFWSYRKWVWVAPATGAADGAWPEPADPSPVPARATAWQHLSSPDGNGQALRVRDGNGQAAGSGNGHGASISRGNGHLAPGQAAAAGASRPSSRSPWDRPADTPAWDPWDSPARRSPPEGWDS